ncbi:MAG: hypoxanthine phosphoribosyltransferase [Candidatus Cloacimonadota bacterium]|nr:MAG: hypoxanthine phosphoribosyltransferase [Candidatus Cloacimonadota bacterium]
MDIYDNFFEPLISEKEILKRCEELGALITEKYKEDGLVAVGILRGCTLFYTELVKHIHCPLVFDFMFVSSYGNEMVSSGVVKIEKDLETNIKNKHVLLIDDIIDTGKTLANLKEMLQARNPKSIEFCTMLDKKAKRESFVDVKFSAFDIDDCFVVGYGLDYKQFYRNMPFIGKLIDGKQPELDKFLEKFE